MQVILNQFLYLNWKKLGDCSWQKGKKKNSCKGFVYLATVTFISEPLVPIVINLMLKTNLSAPHKLSVPMEWVVIDREKYYWILISYSGVCITVILTVLTAYDVMFITVVHHACGLFAITGLVLVTYAYITKLF